VADFDYGAPAGIFARSPARGRHSPVRYQRFGTAAEAIRYAVEQVPPELFPGISIEIDEDTLDHNAIRRLYEDAAYPLTRDSLR
jgi:hypothetical protein